MTTIRPTRAARRLRLENRTDWRSSFGFLGFILSTFLYGAWLAAFAVVSIEDGHADGVAPFIRLGEWALSSSAHMSWSVPLLVTAAITLATLSATALGRTSVNPYFIVGAHVVASILIAWVLAALIGLILDDPTGSAVIRRQREIVWGLFLTAPVGITFGLVAGRFSFAPLDSTIRNLRVQVAHLSQLLRLARWRAVPGWSLARARTMAWMNPIATAAVGVAAIFVTLQMSGYAAPRTTAVFLSVFISLFALWSAATICWRILWNQPPGTLWRSTRTGRRLRALGVLALVAILGPLATVLLIDAGLVIAAAVAADVGPTAIVVVILCCQFAQAAIAARSFHGANAWATISHVKRSRGLERTRTTLDARLAELRAVNRDRWKRPAEWLVRMTSADRAKIR